MQVLGAKLATSLANPINFWSYFISIGFPPNIPAWKNHLRRFGKRLIYDGLKLYDICHHAA
jgi:hypothetical protein